MEYVAGQKDGLQDRKECLCEEMDHIHLLCLLWKRKIPAKMSAPDEAFVLETKRQMEEEMFTEGDKATGAS